MLTAMATAPRALGLGCAILLATGLVATAWAAAGAPCEGNVITNGGFETGPNVPNPPGFIELAKGDTTITGWIVRTGSIDLVRAYWQPAEGENSIDLNGLKAGSVAQRFKVTPNTNYSVTFDLSGNPEGAPAFKKGEIKACTGPFNGESCNFIMPFSYDTIDEKNTRAAMNWQQVKFTFISGSLLNETLVFESQTGGAFGPAIDNVCVIKGDSAGGG
jgi:choice-of-anchor C domain-containing protein